MGDLCVSNCLLLQGKPRLPVLATYPPPRGSAPFLKTSQKETLQPFRCNTYIGKEDLIFTDLSHNLKQQIKCFRVKCYKKEG